MKLFGRLRSFLRGRDNRRETVALASNREAEADLWDPSARGRPPGPERNGAIKKRDERAKEAVRLRQHASVYGGDPLLDLLGGPADGDGGGKP